VFVQWREEQEKEKEEAAEEKVFAFTMLILHAQTHE
jgi:hypothetical protein